jgi:hypothetical protein
VLAGRSTKKAWAHEFIEDSSRFAYIVSVDEVEWSLPDKEGSGIPSRRGLGVLDRGKGKAGCRM